MSEAEYREYAQGEAVVSCVVFIDGWMDGLMDQWMDGWMDGCV